MKIRTTKIPLQTDNASRCKPSDIWQLGQHRLGCLDSTAPDTLFRLFGEKLAGVQMVFADPPYGISIVNRHGTIGKSSRTYRPMIGDTSTDTAIQAYKVYTSLWKDAVQIWWGANYYSDILSPSRCWIIWDKKNDATDFADAELAWTNTKGSVRIFRHQWNGAARASERGEPRLHPTQKPCALFCWVAQKYGAPGGRIFDPFLGSGISIIGAEMLADERSVFGCEISPEYCDVVIQRWERFTGQRAVLLERRENGTNKHL
jgi:DNA modification methylase